jgi:hypothetical protein
MSRRKRIILRILAGVALAAVLVLCGLYFTARHVPAFYRDAMNIDTAALNKGSDRMLQEMAAVQGSTTRAGHWMASVTATDINGWLAVDLVKNHGGRLPPTVHNIRVAIRNNELTIACQYCYGGLDIVLSLVVQPSMVKPNVVALRLIRARAGGLPVPLEQVKERITHAARAMQCQVQWRRIDDDPIALITLPDDPGSEYRTTLEFIELIEAAIHITGKTERRK